MAITLTPRTPLRAPAATAIRAVVDALGPSKASGYQDTTQSWDDVLRVAAIEGACLDAKDTDGTRLIIDLVAQPTINGASTNLEAVDNSTNPPELLYLKWVSVVP